MENRETITIRPATDDDLPLLLSFIRELAEFEELLDQVVATEEGLRSALFGPERVAEVLVGYVGSEPAGFALFFRSFSTFLGRPGIYLEDLYVREPYRGAGLGKALISELASITLARGYGRLEWSVLNWNERAIRFYCSIGASPMDEWTVYRVTGEALERLGRKGG